MRERASMPNTMDNCLSDMPLAMAYVSSQRFENLYAPTDGWHHGTIFADLDKPYEGGCCR
ncbi:MAG: spore coat associated protein CotJA [Clostridia bacterium]|nr:spore coat associated protein CotJA [Clostridia bacterium]